MIGLIGAMAMEVEALEAQMSQRHQTTIGMDTFVSGKLFGQDAVLTVCGPGKVNAALCAQMMILHFHPDWILNIGVAGSGKEGINIGDMVIATAAVQHDVDTTPIGDPLGMVSKLNMVQIPCSPALRERLVRAAKTLPDVTVYQGIIATGDQFVNNGEVRSRIHDRYQSLAVEMEGGAIAHACYVHGVPCGILRSISDRADGKSEMDFPAFAKMAAEHSQKVVECLLREQA